MTGPILLAVHDQPPELEAIRRELTGRYGADYTVICESSPVSALRRLEAVRTEPGQSVLIVFAASEMAAMSGSEFLEGAHELHRHAQRVLLLPWSNLTSQ